MLVIHCIELGFEQRLPSVNDLARNASLPRLTGNQVRLYGPTSAYEVKFNAMTNVSNPREVRVDREGVNSVCVEDEPNNQFDRMMVAAYVG